MFRILFCSIMFVFDTPDVLVRIDNSLGTGTQFANNKYRQIAQLQVNMSALLALSLT